MEETPSGWVVVDREAGVWTRRYSFGAGDANTFVARAGGGKLVVISPCAGLGDRAAAELAELGEVAYVVCNNGYHHLGLGEWRARYPEARFFASPLAAQRVRKRNPAAGSGFEPLEALEPLLGADIGVRDAPGTRFGESWAWAKIEGGYALYASDVLANIPSLPGNFLARQALTLSGSAPGYRIFKLALLVMAKNRKALLRALLQDVQRHPPCVVIPAHGQIVQGGGLAQRTEAMVQAAL